MAASSKTRWILLALLACAAASAHAATQTRTPSSCASVGGIGTAAWLSAGDAVASNDSYATAQIAGAGTTTNYLRCTGYGFSIPSGATINGIIVEVERRSSGTQANGAQDAAMRIVKGGVIGAADRSSGTMYLTTDVTEAHGSAADLWAQSWTPADINAADFGAALATIKSGQGGGTFTISVDVISITVDYDLDTTPPVVSSIVRADASPTGAATVGWTVTFSEPVTGVDAGDFSLLVSGLSASSIASVTGGPTTYTVTTNTGFGIGTLGLDLVDYDSIVDLSGNPLGGAGAGNGNFAGEVYSINRPPPVSSFNVVEPGAHHLTGRIFTKIAGSAIAVDIVALDASNNVSTGFTGTVAVELVDNSSGGACAGLPLIKTLANETFVVANNGRRALAAGQFEAEARRNVKFRIRYPTAAPSVTACSGDAFANRPASFTAVQARDQDRITAGTTRALTNTSNPGSGPVHNAGRPFRLDATAQGSTGATTTLYAPDAGQPLALLSQCGSGTAACTASLGTLSPGNWSASAGVITAIGATYSEAGSFALELEDRTFASVDDADGTATSVRYIRSAAPLTVGRFVPDHFAIAPGAAITPRSAIAACSTAPFTYQGERMDLVFTLQARAFGGSVTQNYQGALAALMLNSAASYGFGAIDSAAPTPLTARLDLSLIPAIGATWSAGVAAIAAPIAIARNATADGPFNAVKLGVAPSDADGVALASFDLDADNSGSPERVQVGPATALRFGRLRLDNAVGSEKLDLPIPMRAQYWNGTAWETNAADSCTSLAPANFALEDYYGGIDAANTGSSHIVLGGAFASGVGSLTLSKPSPAPGAAGGVTLRIDLTAEAKSYLKGNWGVPTYTADPRARIAFGLFGAQPSQFIYFRENY